MSTSNLWCLTSGIFLFLYKAAGLICFFMDVSKNSWFLYLLKIHFEHQLQLLCQGQESGERVVYKYGQWSSSYESGKKAEFLWKCCSSANFYVDLLFKNDCVSWAAQQVSSAFILVREIRLTASPSLLLFVFF